MPLTHTCNLPPLPPTSSSYLDSRYVLDRQQLVERSAVKPTPLQELQEEDKKVDGMEGGMKNQSKAIGACFWLL